MKLALLSTLLTVQAAPDGRHSLSDQRVKFFKFLKKILNFKKPQKSYREYIWLTTAIENCLTEGNNAISDEIKKQMCDAVLGELDRLALLEGCADCINYF